MIKSSKAKKDLWLSRIMACRNSGMPDIVLHMGSMTLDVHNGANESTITNTINALRQLC